MNNELLLKNVGNTIRGLRLSNGLTQEKLSEKIHCDKNTIGNIERGETDLRLTTLNQIAEGLNVSCQKILKESETLQSGLFPPSTNYDYLRLFQYCHKLTPEQFNIICNAAHLYVKANK